MSDTYWVDGEDGLTVGQVVFLSSRTDNNHRGATTEHASATPWHTNMSHERKLRGWLGETNNVSRTALGCGIVRRISRVAKRVQVTTLPDDDPRVIALCDETGAAE